MPQQLPLRDPGKGRRWKLRFCEGEVMDELLPVYEVEELDLDEDVTESLASDSDDDGIDVMVPNWSAEQAWPYPVLRV